MASGGAGWRVERPKGEPGAARLMASVRLPEAQVGRDRPLVLELRARRYTQVLGVSQ